MEQDTIAAIATPLGSSGIGITRISGTQSLPIAIRLFRIPNNCSSHNDAAASISTLPAHQLKYGHIYHPDTGQLVDEVLIAFMKAPKSYTREDVVEIQSHGGPIVQRKILDAVLRCGARLAEPGEFTKRAFLNGRIDLSQAEAVAEIISAKSDAALQIAANQLAGSMKATISSLVEKMIKIQADIEARIDFIEDLDDEADADGLRSSFKQDIISPIKKLIEDYRKGHILRDGLRMDIVGRPNVGKSSLLNQLIRKDKAIVTPVPGTTRDLVEDFFCIGGIPILITDTAGLHATDDPVEIIGMQKTRDNISRSDLVLFVIDASTLNEQGDHAVFEQINARNTILVINKGDLLTEGVVPVLPHAYRQLPSVIVSALKGNGIGELEKTIQEVCLSGLSINPGRDLVPTLRQRIALEQAMEPLSRAYQALGGSVVDELVAEDIESAKRILNRILGEDVEYDVLDEIFKNFCIGK
ncbi:MAG: tRNA uridine-5-carboxymethylaminomethyl(34) synthesis GTPase MnmE [Desulfobacteraceae bacterium]|jgi:tRNA modification GTPase